MSRHVSYFYEADANSHHFSTEHPMVPERVNMTHELVQGYGMFSKMKVMGFQPASKEDLKQIHWSDYVDWLSRITPQTLKVISPFKATQDCPLFEGVFDYTSSIVGGSLACAQKINQGESEICINWSGGMHHARRGQASGFCYTNDIVACIMDLLRYHRRVMYIDVDVHHGDGVEEMFLDTNRVMTISFHQYGGDFFPYTGGCEERGIGKGRNFAINVPLKPGIRDEPYLNLFTKIIASAMERFQPEALVVQMGADSVAGDKLGRFNLSNTAHSECLKFALSFQIPTIVLGGGGYSYYNVARTWTLETGTILGLDLDDILPATSYTGLPDQLLRIPSQSGRDRNTPKYLQSILESTLTTISQSELVPSVPLQSIPPDNYHESSQDIELIQSDFRVPGFLPTTNQNLDDVSEPSSSSLPLRSDLSSDPPVPPTLNTPEILLSPLLPPHSTN